jgi:hypothetical protein
MQKKSIHKYLGLPDNWPIKDNLKHSIVLMPNAKDIRTAKKSDPAACALHNAACRQLEISNCAIGGRIAYIPQKDEKGNWYIGRFAAPPKTMAAIKRFDRRGEIPEGGFRFKPVSESNRLDHKRRYNRLWRNGKVGGGGRKFQWRRPARCMNLTLAENAA